MTDTLLDKDAPATIEQKKAAIIAAACIALGVGIGYQTDDILSDDIVYADKFVQDITPKDYDAMTNIVGEDWQSCSLQVGSDPEGKPVKFAVCGFKKQVTNEKGELVDAMEAKDITPVDTTDLSTIVLKNVSDAVWSQCQPVAGSDPEGKPVKFATCQYQRLVKVKSGSDLPKGKAVEVFVKEDEPI